MSPVVRLMPVCDADRVGLAGRCERDARRAGRRVDLDPAVAAAERDVGALLEAEPVDVERDRAVLVGGWNRDEVDRVDAGGGGGHGVLSCVVGCLALRPRPSPKLIVPRKAVARERRAHAQLRVRPARSCDMANPSRSHACRAALVVSAVVALSPAAPALADAPWSAPATITAGDPELAEPSIGFGCQRPRRALRAAHDARATASPAAASAGSSASSPTAASPAARGSCSPRRRRHTAPPAWRSCACRSPRATGRSATPAPAFQPRLQLRPQRRAAGGAGRGLPPPDQARRPLQRRDRGEPRAATSSPRGSSISVGATTSSPPSAGPATPSATRR